MIIKWYRNDGSVESWVKLVPSLYRINTYWDESPSDDICARVDTDG